MERDMSMIDGGFINSVRCNACDTDLEGVAELLDAAEDFIKKLKEIHECLEYQSVWTMYAIHGGQYNGPSYEDEFNILQKAVDRLKSA